MRTPFDDFHHESPYSGCADIDADQKALVFEIGSCKSLRRAFRWLAYDASSELVSPRDEDRDGRHLVFETPCERDALTSGLLREGHKVLRKPCEQADLMAALRDVSRAHQ